LRHLECLESIQVPCWSRFAPSWSRTFDGTFNSVKSTVKGSGSETIRGELGIILGISWSRHGASDRILECLDAMWVRCWNRFR
jgi:hypothetical protein